VQPGVLTPMLPLPGPLQPRPSLAHFGLPVLGILLTRGARQLVCQELVVFHLTAP